MCTYQGWLDYAIDFYIFADIVGKTQIGGYSKIPVEMTEAHVGVDQ